MISCLASPKTYLCPQSDGIFNEFFGAADAEEAMNALLDYLPYLFICTLFWCPMMLLFALDNNWAKLLRTTDFLHEQVSGHLDINSRHHHQHPNTTRQPATRLPPPTVTTTHNPLSIAFFTSASP